MFDYDNGISKKNKSMLEKHGSNIIICKVHLEHFFWNHKDLDKKSKSQFADKFTNMTNEELGTLIEEITNLSITSVNNIVDHERCSNLLTFLQNLSPLNSMSNI